MLQAFIWLNALKLLVRYLASLNYIAIFLVASLSLLLLLPEIWMKVATTFTVLNYY